MRMLWLRSTLMLSLCTVSAATAWAGGTGGTGGTGTGSGSDTGGTDTGGTETEGTGTGGTDSGGTDTGEMSTGMMCTECTPAGEMVQIVSPMDGQVVSNQLDVRVTAPYTCACDTCGCYERDPFSVSLRVDGSTEASCSSGDDECNTRDQTFSIVLTPGTHTLDAAADVDGVAQFSDPIEVTVPGDPGGDTTAGDSGPPPPPPPPADTGSGSSGDTSGAASDDGGGGCGCRTQGDLGPAGALFAMLALGLGRRRRR